MDSSLLISFDPLNSSQRSCLQPPLIPPHTETTEHEQLSLSVYFSRPPVISPHSSPRKGFSSNSENLIELGDGGDDGFLASPLIILDGLSPKANPLQISSLHLETKLQSRHEPEQEFAAMKSPRRKPLGGIENAVLHSPVTTPARNKSLAGMYKSLAEPVISTPVTAVHISAGPATDLAPETPETVRPVRTLDAGRSNLPELPPTEEHPNEHLEEIPVKVGVVDEPLVNEILLEVPSLDSTDQEAVLPPPPDITVETAESVPESTASGSEQDVPPPGAAGVSQTLSPSSIPDPRKDNRVSLDLHSMVQIQRALREVNYDLLHDDMSFLAKSAAEDSMIYVSNDVPDVFAARKKSLAKIVDEVIPDSPIRESRVASPDLQHEVQALQDAEAPAQRRAEPPKTREPLLKLSTPVNPIPRSNPVVPALVKLPDSPMQDILPSAPLRGHARHHSDSRPALLKFAARVEPAQRLKPIRSTDVPGSANAVSTGTSAKPAVASKLPGRGRESLVGTSRPRTAPADDVQPAQMARVPAPIARSATLLDLQPVRPGRERTTAAAALERPGSALGRPSSSLATRRPSLSAGQPSIVPPARPVSRITQAPMRSVSSAALGSIASVRQPPATPVLPRSITPTSTTRPRVPPTASRPRVSNIPETPARSTSLLRLQPSRPASRAAPPSAFITRRKAP